jgi:hypothetical protein
MSPHAGVNYFHQSASNSSTSVGGTGGDTRLVSVIIGTGASSGVVTIHDGTSAGATVAVINGASAGNYYFGGARMQTGQLTVVTSGGASDVTVTYV